MKDILCFGDSNTYGESPEGFGRYKCAQRWPGILSRLLGEGYHLVEEGLNGRTTVWDDPVEIGKSGLRQLPVLLISHAPLDLVIVMLGTNDLKRRFSATPSDIALGMEQVVKTILKTENGRRAEPPQVLLVSPIPLAEETFLGEVFGSRREDSLRLGGLYREVAKRNGAHYLCAADFAGPSPLDGLHLDLAGHEAIARAMAEKITHIFAAGQGEGA